MSSEDPIAVIAAKDYEAILRYGSAERWVADGDAADAWRSKMRKAARADRLAIRTFAHHRRGGPMDGGRYVVAWLPNHTMSPEDEAEQEAINAAKLDAFYEDHRDG